MMGEISKKLARKFLKVRLGFTISWADFEKIVTSFDFTQHHFDRLTFFGIDELLHVIPLP